MGSPLVRTLVASDRQSLPPGPAEKHIETMIKLLRTLRSEAMDAGVKFAIENHKDLFCRADAPAHRWRRQGVRGLVSRYRQSGFRHGGPAPDRGDARSRGRDVASARLGGVRNAHRRGRRNGCRWARAWWISAASWRCAKEICPPLYVYIKPITGRPPQNLAILEPDFWKMWPDARASDVARFLALAKRGHPYERDMVVEDVAGRSNIETFAAALAIPAARPHGAQRGVWQKGPRPGREVARVNGPPARGSL